MLAAFTPKKAFYYLFDQKGKHNTHLLTITEVELDFFSSSKSSSAPFRKAVSFSYGIW
jgi:hypothetical protein